LRFRIDNPNWSFFAISEWTNGIERAITGILESWGHQLGIDVICRYNSAIFFLLRHI
jgi:hypothetical protein